MLNKDNKEHRIVLINYDQVRWYFHPKENLPNYKDRDVIKIHPTSKKDIMINGLNYKLTSVKENKQMDLYKWK